MFAHCAHNNIMEISTSKRKTRPLLSAIFGVAVGAANGLFGGGGGMIAVPALTLTGVPSKKAHATAIAIILPLSLISGAVYLAKGAADPSVILPSCAGVFVGGIVGALLLKKIDSRGLSLLFYALMIAAGLKLSL